VEIGRQIIEGVTVLKPNGPLAKTDADELKGVAGEAGATTAGRTVLDASAIPFVDSRGLEVLLDITEDMQRDGEILRVVESNETLREVLKITGLENEFEFYDDMKSAVESFEVSQ